MTNRGKLQEAIEKWLEEQGYYTPLKTGTRQGDPIPSTGGPRDLYVSSSISAGVLELHIYTPLRCLMSIELTEGEIINLQEKTSEFLRRKLREKQNAKSEATGTCRPGEILWTPDSEAPSRGDSS